MLLQVVLALLKAVFAERSSEIGQNVFERAKACQVRATARGRRLGRRLGRVGWAPRVICNSPPPAPRPARLLREALRILSRRQPFVARSVAMSSDARALGVVLRAFHGVPLVEEAPATRVYTWFT